MELFAVTIVCSPKEKKKSHYNGQTSQFTGVITIRALFVLFTLYNCIVSRHSL